MANTDIEEITIDNIETAHKNIKIKINQDIDSFNESIDNLASMLREKYNVANSFDQHSEKTIVSFIVS